MKVYGALTAVRNRGGAKKSKSSNDKETKQCPVKKESIKRKFYRWLPDLEERFYRDENGQYQPIHGHEQEVQYRKEMREKSFASVAKKRARSNQRNNNLKKGLGGNEKPELPRVETSPPNLTSERGTRSSNIPFLSRRSLTFEDRAIILPLVSEDECDSPMDNSFHANVSIFDEVNQEFFGEEIPSSSSSSYIDIESGPSLQYSDVKMLGGSANMISGNSWEDNLEELWDASMLSILDPVLE